MQFEILGHLRSAKETAGHSFAQGFCQCVDFSNDQSRLLFMRSMRDKSIRVSLVLRGVAHQACVARNIPAQALIEAIEQFFFIFL
jgi:hypothetical protein